VSNDDPPSPTPLPETDAAVLETLLSGTPFGFGLIGRDYRYLRVSRSLAELNSRSVEEHLGRHAAEIVGERYWPLLRPLFDRALSGEPVLDQEISAYPKGDRGRLHHYRVSYYPVRVGGTVEGVGIVVLDVTRQKEAEAELRDAHQRLTFQQEALQTAYEREHRIAEVLQRSLLRPPKPGAFPGLAVEPLYKAARDEALVGGDFFDAFALPDGRVALVVGDVSGKGLVAAESTAEVRYTLRAYLRDGAAGAPHAAATALTRLNGHLAGDTGFGGPADGFVFVGLALAVLDGSTGQGHVAVAGMEAPLVVRAEGGRMAEPLAVSAPPLGVDASVTYDPLPFTLTPSDTLLLVSDGLTEARDPAREFLGYERLAEIARVSLARHPDDLAAAARCVFDAAEAFAGGRLQDDACLLLARRLPA
jgi:PAS domain S-box-containing protein